MDHLVLQLLLEEVELEVHQDQLHLLQEVLLFFQQLHQQVVVKEVDYLEDQEMLRQEDQEEVEQENQYQEDLEQQERVILLQQVHLKEIQEDLDQHHNQMDQQEAEVEQVEQDQLDLDLKEEMEE